MVKHFVYGVIVAYQVARLVVQHRKVSGLAEWSEIIGITPQITLRS